MTWFKDLLIITLITTVLFGAMLGSYPLDCPDGARYAEIPREMLVTGDYVTPHLNGLKYFEKPPLFYWMQLTSYKLFGVNDFAAKVMNAVVSILCSLMVYFAARKIFNRRTGLFAGLILATSILFFILAHIVTLDMTLTLFLSSALLMFFIGANTFSASRSRKYYFLSSYLFIALAVMTKGLVGMVLPGLIIGFYCLIFNEWRNLKSYYILPGAILFLMVTLPWHILVQLRNPEFSYFYFIDQHFLRYLTPYAKRMQEWWFLPAVLFGGFFPWVTFLVQALWYNLPIVLAKEGRDNHIGQARRALLGNYKAQIFLFVWPALIFIFYAFSDSKLLTYLLPLMPPLAILTGKYFGDNWQRKRSLGFSVGFVAIGILNLVLGIMLFFLPGFLDAGQQYLAKTYFFVAGIVLICCGGVSGLMYFRHGVQKGFLALLLGMAVFFLSIKPLIPVFNGKSIKPLIVLLKTQLGAQDEVVSFQTYYQDLPFYLERKVTVVNYGGELSFGIKHTKNATDWMIDNNVFVKRWQSENRMFVITNIKNYPLLKSYGIKMFVIGKYKDNILVTNML